MSGTWLRYFEIKLSLQSQLCLTPTSAFYLAMGGGGVARFLDATSFILPSVDFFFFFSRDFQLFATELQFPAAFLTLYYMGKQVWFLFLSFLFFRDSRQAWVP